jgi:hypothetical protein
VTARNNVAQAGRYIIEFTTAGAGTTHRFDANALFTSDASGRFVKWDDDSGCCSSLARFQAATGQETASLGVSAAGEFVNAGSGDFRLKPASQLVNRGMVLPGINDPGSAWPYAGSAPDLGAFEQDEAR